MTIVQRSEIFSGFGFGWAEASFGVRLEDNRQFQVMVRVQPGDATGEKYACRELLKLWARMEEYGFDEGVARPFPRYTVLLQAV